MNEKIVQIRNIRALCRLMTEQHESILRLISDKLDELEAECLAANDNSCISGEEGNSGSK